MANLRGLRGSEWVGVGCVGRSGLRGSEWVKWFKGKTSFPCIIDILRPTPTHSNPLRPTQPTPTHSNPLNPLGLVNPVSMHLNSFAMPVVAQIIVTFYYATGP